MNNHFPLQVNLGDDDQAVAFYNPEELNSEEYKWSSAAKVPYDALINVHSTQDGSKNFVVQIDAERANGATVHVCLNDSDLYIGDPERDENALTAVRQIREAVGFARGLNRKDLSLDTLERILKEVTL